MKINDSFITYYTTDCEQILVSTDNSGFRGMVRSNKTAAFVIDCLKENRSRTELIEKMTEKFDAPENALAQDVDRVLEVLRSIGALDE